MQYQKRAAVAALLAMSCLAVGAELDAVQKRLLAEAASVLKSVEGTVKAASDSAGADAHLTGSRAKLTATRVATATTQLQQATERLAKLPADHADVRALQTRADTAAATIKSLEAKLAPAPAVEPPRAPEPAPPGRIDQIAPMLEQSQIGKAINGNPEAEFDRDMDRLRGLGNTYSDAANRVQRADAAELVRNFPAARAEAARVAQVYAATAPGSQREALDVATRFWREQEQQFSAVIAQRRQQLPAEIEQAFGQARMWGEMATKDKNPLLLTNGCTQSLEEADAKIALLDAIDAPAAAPLREQRAALATQFKQQQVALREEIIQANELPPDRYAGDDKTKLYAIAKTTWENIHLGGQTEVIGCRIPSQQWERQTVWRYENREWRLIDRSRLQVQLLVKHDDKLAVVRPINFSKDHLSNDAITQSAMDSPTDDLPPQRFVLLSKVK